jgi:hypothetical protein
MLYFSLGSSSGFWTPENENEYRETHFVRRKAQFGQYFAAQQQSTASSCLKSLMLGFCLLCKRFMMWPFLALPLDLRAFSGASE